jgi:ketosteroid isomerase-like protein
VSGVDVLSALYDAWNRQDVDGGVALTHPDVEFHSSGDFPGMSSVYRGREEMRGVYEDLAGLWERLELVPREYHELPDGGVLALYTFIGHGRDGITVERDAAQIVTVEDGLVRSMRTFGSWAEARAAAGLGE